MVQCLRSVNPLSHLFRGGGSFFHIIFKGSSLNSLILTLLHLANWKSSIRKIATLYYILYIEPISPHPQWSRSQY